MRRCEYLTMSQVLADPVGDAADVRWTIVIDRKTGICYSGLPAWKVPGKALWLREDVELFLIDQEPERKERLLREFVSFPARKSI